MMAAVDEEVVSLTSGSWFCSGFRIQGSGFRVQEKEFFCCRALGQADRMANTRQKLDW
jgi:hypothetical protein